MKDTQSHPVRELDGAEQRAEAWATWERIQVGDRREVSRADFDADFAEALRQVSAPRSV